MAKEAYLYGKRGLFGYGKRRLFVYGKRGLLILKYLGGLSPLILSPFIGSFGAIGLKNTFYSKRTHSIAREDIL